MEGAAVASGGGTQDQSQLQQQPQGRVVERLNPVVQQQLNLDSIKTRAISLFKAISRILESFDAVAHTNVVPKWQDILGQFSMVNLELFNIVEDIKKVSKAFVVHPKNVNVENATSMDLYPLHYVYIEMRRHHIRDNLSSTGVLASFMRIDVGFL